MAALHRALRDPSQSFVCKQKIDLQFGFAVVNYWLDNIMHLLSVCRDSRIQFIVSDERNLQTLPITIDSKQINIYYCSVIIAWSGDKI